MKTLYLECKMGASGDMMLGTLLNFISDKDRWVEQFNQIGIPRMEAAWKMGSRCGISGIQMSIRIGGQEEHSEDLPGNPDACHHHGSHPGHHSHSNLASIHEIIGSLKVSDSVKEKALAVYQTLAEAEAAVHGRSVEMVHFHEVGQLDAVADIVGTCMLLEEIAPDKILASPIHVGSGQVRCAHGILPVPAPATTLLLKGIPFYSGEIQGELCTPTGAALLRFFVDEFTQTPMIQYEQTGCGLGGKELEAANLLRAFLSDSPQELRRSSRTITELRCSLDDMSPEAIGYAQDILLQAGALDVFTAAIQMKKNRPGTLLCVTCTEEKTEEMARLMLLHTTTAGVRRLLYDRYTLDYYFTEKETPFGTIRLKHYTGYGIEKVKPEYQDVARLARETGRPYDEISRLALQDLQ